jgi:hypothetical protein
LHSKRGKLAAKSPARLASGRRLQQAHALLALEPQLLLHCKAADWAVLVRQLCPAALLRV